MKKTLGKYMVAGVVALTMTGCNDSFLDRTPINNLINDSYWTTAAELEAYTNGIYNEAASNGTYKFMIGFHNSAWPVKQQGPYAMETMSDNFASMDGAQTWASAVAAGMENQPNGNPNYSSWDWSLLRRINVFMENYNRATGVKEEIRNRYAGEALFFRAWFYFHMVQTYGDVPLILRPLDTSSEELYGARTPRLDVMKQVMEDISNACTYLPVKNWGDNRLTKGAALALKSRIALYEGTYRKYHNIGTEAEYKALLRECALACEELMGDDFEYEIYDKDKPAEDYTVLFTTDDLKDNPEVIFYRRYAAGLKRHRMCGYTVNLRNGATKDFVDDFLFVKDGKAMPIALATEYSNDTPEQEFANRDPRLAQTILAPGRDAAKKLFQDFKLADNQYPRLGNMTNWSSLTGYHAIKYYIREQDKKGFNAETHDYPLFRYAEVLLNYAEAKAELGECTEAVLDETINVLRDRAGVPALSVNPPMDPKYAGKGISALLVEIRRERRVELSFEYLRYQDLMRWAWGDKLKEQVLGIRFEEADFSNPRYEGRVSTSGKNPIKVVTVDGKQYIDAYGGTHYETAKRSFNPAKDYLRPIPSSAISKNTNIVQNPNW